MVTIHAGDGTQGGKWTKKGKQNKRTQTKRKPICHFTFNATNVTWLVVFPFSNAVFWCCLYWNVHFFFFKQPELYLVVDWWWLLHILLRVLTTVLLINAPFLCVCLSLFPLSPPFLVCHACEWLLCFSGIVPLSLLAQCVASPMVLGPSWCSCCTLLENWLLPSLNV